MINFYTKSLDLVVKCINIKVKDIFNESVMHINLMIVVERPFL